MPSATTDDGLTLSWTERGSGAPLLCHAGGPGCASRYYGDLAQLAAERTLLLLDPRGTGASDRPPDPSAYRLEQYAADVEMVRKHLGLDRLDLLGHSHGGFVAIVWAATYPESVGRLVLASSTPRFTDAVREARRVRVASHAGQPYFQDALDALQAHQEGRYANDEELAALYRREWPLFLPVGSDGSTIAAVLSRAGNNADALRYFNEHVSNGMDLRPQLASIHSPTLVITGELDPFESSAREIAEALPDATVVVQPNADHFPFLEPHSRAGWSRAVLRFLAA